MKASISVSAGSGQEVSPFILGHNIETALTTVDGFLSDRLRNPKFLGPAHRMTGIAPEWQGASCGRAAYELTPAAGLLGSDAQMIRSPEDDRGPTLHQNRISVRENERFELEIWARALHEPAALIVELRPMPKMLEPYSSAELVIDAPYFKRYTVPLRALRDDDDARLSITVQGRGALWFDQIHLRPIDEPLLCSKLVSAIGGMQIPTLRFPGGIITASYNWKHGTGPVHLRPDLLDAAFHQDWYLHYDFGTDEFLELCLEQGITPALTLNVATGTPDEAGEWAAYCASWYHARGEEPPMIYWHIGNHPYAPTIARMTPEMYVDVLKTFVPAVKSGYPNSRIVAVMSRADLDPDAKDPRWREAILEHAFDLVDVLQIQNYGGCGARPEAAGSYAGGLADPRALVEQAADQISGFDTALRAFIAMAAERGLPIRLGVAEWNWWMQASHWDGHDFEEPPLVLHALYVAGMIHSFAANAPYLEVAHFYNLVNCMGIVNHRNADVEITGVAEVFRLYRPALPGRLLNTTVQSPPLGTAATVQAMAIEQDEHDWLFVVNRDPLEECSIELSGVTIDPDSIECLAGESPTGRLGPAAAEARNGVLITPPLSIVRCRIPKAGR